jgi:hypothetical protein
MSNTRHGKIWVWWRRSKKKERGRGEFYSATKVKIFVL